MLMNDVAYGLIVETKLSYERAVELSRSLLRDEGFGVQCDIDVSTTVREKIGESFRPYRILGVCNPQLAHKALTAEPQLGLMLPCNLVVQEVEGRVVVSAIDPRAMMRFVGNASLGAIANEVYEALKRVLDRISTATR